MHVAFGFHTLRFNVPLGPAYLASALRRAGHRPSVFVFGRHPERAIASLRSDPPDLVAYGPLSGEHGEHLAFHRRLSGILPVPSVWGGAHPTFSPEFALEEGVDAVCAGEGEEALVEFVDRFARTGDVPRDVRNFRIRDGGGKVAENPVRPPVRDLDGLPFPARDLFLEARPFLRHHGILHVIARRGCPGSCTYCFHPAWRALYGECGTAIRRRTPGNVCDEILDFRRDFRPDLVAFVDDAFAESREWLENFAEVYPRRVGLPYSCNLRPEDCTPENVGTLAATGCRLAYVGVESGDDGIRRILGRPMPDRTIRDALRRLDAQGIRTITENMVGIPGETFTQALKTLRLNQEIRPTFANCSFFTPYPGLPLTRRAIRHGHFDGEYGKLRENYYHASPTVSGETGEANRIVNLRPFFGLLSRHPGAWPLVRPFLDARPNALIRRLGDILDGYGLLGCLPYRLTPRSFTRLAIAYLRFYR